MKHIERKVSKYLYRRQLFYTVRRHVDMCQPDFLGDMIGRSPDDYEDD